MTRTYAGVRGTAPRIHLGAAFLGSALALVGCAKNGSTSAGPSDPGARTVRDTEISHEACDVQGSGVEKLSASGTAPEIFVVRSGGREACRGIDFNRDGRMDAWSYSDDGGRPRRWEGDFDRDGRIDQIDIYKGGALVESQLATSLRGRLDTWKFYQGGKLTRTERDSDGDSVIDQWWEYPKSEDCPMIHTDADGDGRPDPGSTVDYCKETGYVPPDKPGDGKVQSPDFGKPSDVPTEQDAPAQDGKEGKP